MRAIQVQAWGSQPSYTTSAAPPPAPSADDQHSIRVLASSLPQLVKSQAAGSHYSVKGAPLPYTPGADGIGLLETSDPAAPPQLVFFNSIRRGGGFAERITVPAAAVVALPLPADLQDQAPATADLAAALKPLAIRLAALANPAMSGWMALRTRSTDLPVGFSVLILGATTMGGRVAARIAREVLGAGKVVGAARRRGELDALVAAGVLDGYAVLDGADTDYAPALAAAGGRVDVVLDYVWGAGTRALLDQLPADAFRAEGLRTQLVDIGTLSGEDLVVPGATLRSKNITISGAGPGSWSMGQLAKEIPVMLETLINWGGDKDQFGPVVVKGLDDVEGAWAEKKARVVFVP